MHMTPCSGSSGDRWFSDNQDDIKAAKAGCGRCPRQRFAACREQGWQSEHGVFGGLSAADRRELDPLRMARAGRENRRAADETDRRIILSRNPSPPTAADATRQRGLEMVARGATSRRTAAILGVAPATVRSWVRRNKAS